MSAIRHELSLGSGAAAGVAAFVAGYLATYVLAASRLRSALRDVNVLLQFFGGEPIPVWKAAGWLYFNEHFARTTVSAFSGTRSLNLLGNGGVSTLLYLVPVIVLAGAGFVLARSRNPMDERDGALVGARVAVGYVGAAIVGVFLFGVTRGDAAISPDPISGVLLAGVLYPLVFGAVGGALAVVVRERSAGSREATAD